MDVRPVPQRTRPTAPRGGLQAAEYEELGYGLLTAVGRSVLYIDEATRSVPLRFSYASPAEASLQLQFFRETYQDAKRRRA
jgi:hypothetical protein